MMTPAATLARVGRPLGHVPVVPGRRRAGRPDGADDERPTGRAVRS